MALKVERGKKYSAQEARAIVDELYGKVRQRWEARVNQKPFMQQLMAGTLPLTHAANIFSQLGRLHDRDQHADRLHLPQEHYVFKSEPRSDGAHR